MKKLIALLAAAALLVTTLTGCGSSGAGHGFSLRREPELFSKITGTVNYDDVLIDKYTAYPGAGNVIDVNDCEYYDEVFGSYMPTLEDLYQAVDDSETIAVACKPMVKDFCRALAETYPEADLRVLYFNLQSLNLRLVDEIELQLCIWDDKAVACYLARSNEAVLLESYDFSPGTWGYQCVFHEMSHAARIMWREINGNYYKVSTRGSNCDMMIIDETLNTVFSVSLLGYEERDIGYQAASNLMTAIICSLDNYRLEDYINHSQSYFLYRLDEFTGMQGYAYEMMELLQYLYDTSHNGKHISRAKLAPLYDYVSFIYYKNRITPGTSYEEALAIRDELIDIVMFDVPEEFHLNPNRMLQFFDSYCRYVGIT